MAGHRDEAGIVRLSRGQMLLAYLSGSFGFGFGTMVSFVVPLRAKELGASPELVGLIVSAGALLSVPLAMPIGVLIDRLGPRRAYVLGTALTAVGSLFLTAAPSFWAILVLQLLFGVPRGVPWIAAQVYITGIGSPAEQPAITGRFSFFVNGGMFVAPLMVGVVAEAMGYQYSFLFLALVAAGFTGIGLALPEIQARAPGTASRVGSFVGFGDAVAALRLTGIQIMILFSLARVWIWTVWPSFFPLYLEDRGFSPGLIGTVLALRGAFATLAPLGAGWVQRLAGTEVGAAATVALMALGMVLSPHLATFPLVYLPAILLGVGDGLNLPLLLVITGAAAPPGQRGIATAMRVGANQGASIVAPVAGGALVAWTGIALGFALSTVIGLGLLGAGLWRYTVKRRQRLAAPSYQG